MWRGGDGLVREYEMLADATVTVLSERRRGRPYGAAGGEPGQSGRNTLIRASGRPASAAKEETLPGKVELQLHPGDRLRIETPGGGGFGVDTAATG
jgi:N-methylhydantoinase B/oxoprolinase/acetone carboxylase alpha subunit